MGNRTAYTAFQALGGISHPFGGVIELRRYLGYHTAGAGAATYVAVGFELKQGTDPGALHAVVLDWKIVTDDANVALVCIEQQAAYWQRLQAGEGMPGVSGQNFLLQPTATVAVVGQEAMAAEGAGTLNLGRAIPGQTALVSVIFDDDTENKDYVAEMAVAVSSREIVLPTYVNWKSLI